MIHIITDKDNLELKNNDYFDELQYKSRAIIINDNLEVILVEYANALMFPGGKIDKDEKFIEGLIREIKEELGIELTEKEAIPFINYVAYLKDYPNKDGKIINKYTKTIYYIVRTNKNINLNNTKLTSSEKNNNFNIKKINMFGLEKYVENYSSTNPRYKYFKEELLEVINELKLSLLNELFKDAIKNRSDVATLPPSSYIDNNTIKHTKTKEKIK